MAFVDRILRSDLLTAALRFPLPVLCALTLTVIHWRYAASRQPMVPLALCLLAAFFWSWAAALFSEATQRPFASAALTILGLLVIGLAFDFLSALHLWEVWESDSTRANVDAPRLFLLGFLILAPALAPCIAGDRSQSAYWQFNHKWVVAGLVAGLGALSAWAGYWIILETLRLLFSVEATPALMEKGRVVAVWLIFPLIWLTLTPSDLSEEIRTGKDKEFTARAVELFVAYILIPVAVILSGLLAAYVVKILVDRTFLTSRLGFTAALYAAGIILAALLAWQQRGESSYVGLFWRGFPYLLIAPILLLVPALWVRIIGYGWTPERYLAVLAAIWVMIIAINFVLPRWGGDLRVIAGSAALLLVLATLGPWSVEEVSSRSQLARMEALLVQKGWLVNGRWSRPKHVEGSASGWAETHTLHSALGTLRFVGQLDLLRPWFAGHPDDPFATSTRSSLEWKLQDLLTVPPPREPPKPEFLSFSTVSPYTIRVESPSLVIGPIKYEPDPDRVPNHQRVMMVEDTPLGPLTVSFNDNGPQIEDAKGHKKTIDWVALLKAWVAEQKVMGLSRSKQPRILEGIGDLPVKLVVVELSGSFSPDKVTFNWVTMYLLLDP